MQVSDLMHSLTVAGISIRHGGCDSLELTGAIQRLTQEQRESLALHKQTLLQMLTPEPDAQGEREAIANEHSLPEPIDDWDSLPRLPPLPTIANVKDCPEDWQEDPQYRYIGRASKRLGLPQSLYHNPYPIGRPETPEKRLACIEKYRGRLLGSTMLQAQAKAELPGKILVCFCRPNPCHGDVLRQFIAEAGWDEKYVAWWNSHASTATLSESPQSCELRGDSDHNRPS